MTRAQHERAALDRLMHELQQRLEAQKKTNADVGSAPMVIASFILPASLRGANDVTPIALPPHVDAVRLQAPLETTRFSTLDAEIRDAATNQIAWRGANIEPDRRTVAVTIPASVLKSRTYLLELRGPRRPGATPEPLAAHVFKVVMTLSGGGVSEP
jgi:hypothetical protein